jgi:uncharacterized membrane protein YbhN (UPF0104 family)
LVSKQPSTRKKWLFRALKLVILVLVVWAVRGTLLSAWDQLHEGEQDWVFRPGWAVIAGALYLVGLLPAAIFWHRVLRVLGQDARLGKTLRAHLVGHLGKYVPGKAMVVIIRTGLVRGPRVHTGVAAASVFLETLTMMAVGAFLAAAILAVGFRGQNALFWGAIGLMVVAGLPTLPPVFKRLARAVGVGKSDPVVAEKIERLGFPTLLTGWGLMALGWFILGLSYWATLRAMDISGLDPIVGLPGYTAAVSLAMVAGFLLLILPGGIGVREFALMVVMTNYLRGLPGVEDPEATALISAALLRLVWLAAELLIAGILYPLGMRKHDPPEPSSPAST